MYTYVSEFGHWYVDQPCHLLVPAVDLASPAPTARWDGHASENTIVLHQASIKPYLDTDEVYVCGGLNTLAELWSEPV